MPQSFLLAYQNLLPQAKTPLWTYTGLAILVVLFAAAYIADKKKKESSGLTLDPQPGEIFQFRAKDNQNTANLLANLIERNIV